jgi:hypothetical protein
MTDVLVECAQELPCALLLKVLQAIYGDKFDILYPGPCDITTCDTKVGQCVKAPKPNGAICDDNVMCTVNDVCQNGLCTGRKVTKEDDFPELWEACLEEVPRDSSDDGMNQHHKTRVSYFPLDSNAGVIAGAVIGSIVGAALLAGAAFFVYRRYFAAKPVPPTVTAGEKAFNPVCHQPLLLLTDILFHGCR